MNRSTLHIEREDTIRSVQERFSKMYPYLGINFFRSQGSRAGGQGLIVKPETKVGELNRRFIDAEYEFGENTSVAGFEKGFSEKFGLVVQVTRRSGKLWMETNLTDHLTLREQNELGKEITVSREMPAYTGHTPY